MTKIILIAGVVVIVALGAFLFLQQEDGDDQAGLGGATEEGATTKEGDTTAEGDDEGGAMMEGDGVVKSVIVYSDSGFAPKDLTIQMGETVTFRNESSRVVWPATAVHPSHTVYPGSSIQNCFDGSDTTGVFDACGDIAQGGEWLFTFEEKGSWNYHDHRRSSNWGTINVE